MARSRGRLALLAFALTLAAVPVPTRAGAEPGAASVAERLGLEVQDRERARQAVASRSAGAEPQVVPGSLLVTVEPGQAEALSAAVLGGRLGGARGAAVVAAATPVGPHVVRVGVAVGQEQAVAAALRSRPDVIAVEPDLRLHLALVPDDPFYPEQFAHRLTGVEDAWDVTTGGRALTVAVIDSGIVADHPDLAGLVVDQVNTASGEVRPGARDNDSCRVGHGTWVAGIIGALGDNRLDVAGATHGVRFVDVDVADPEGCAEGATTLGGVLAGLDYATARGVDLVNLSLGGSGRSCPTALQATLDATRAAGIPVVAAAGNAGPGTIGVPAACNGVISVGGIGPTGAPASYASTNPYVDLTAPSGDDVDRDGELTSAEGVLSTSWWAFGERTPSVLPLSGTSFSAPYVTGVAALLLSVRPDLTPDQVEAILEATATDQGAPGRDAESGFGLVDPAGAVALVQRGGPLPRPEPDLDFPAGSPAGLRPGGDVEVLRIAAGTGTTEPITQAVAVSQALFDDQQGDRSAAQYAVLARGDLFADALTGGPLTFGVAPLLFTSSSGDLAAPTAAELRRVLPPGAGVLVLGGALAVPAGVDEDLRALGYDPIRLAGGTREQTAVAAAEALRQIAADLGVELPTAILASRDVWYDAITAGSLAAALPAPILLTGSDGLDPAAAAALDALAVEQLYVVGGEVRIPAAVRQQAATVAPQATVTVLAGAARDGTAVAVAAELERLAGEFDQTPAAVIGVNLTRDDGYAHALSVAPILALSPSVYLPLLGPDGSELTPATIGHFFGIGLPAVLAGDVDLISAAGAAQLERVLERSEAQRVHLIETAPPPG